MMVRPQPKHGELAEAELGAARRSGDPLLYDRLAVHLLREARAWRHTAETLSEHVAVLKKQRRGATEGAFEAAAARIAAVLEEEAGGGGK